MVGRSEEAGRGTGNLEEIDRFHDRIAWIGQGSQELKSKDERN